MKPSGLVNLFLVPVLVGIISSATVWWFLQRERSELHLTLLSRSAIVDAERAALPPELKITYKDQPVKKLELLSFALTNSGTRTILPEQFKADISIVIPGRVIAAYSVAGLPRPLIAPISHTDQTVSVGPMLLNREDRALFNAITVDAQANAMVYPEQIRVADVPDLGFDDQSLSRGKKDSRWTQVVAGLAGMIMSLLTAIITERTKRRRSQSSGKPLVIHSAKYGQNGSNADLLNALRDRVVDNGLEVVASNRLGGDPCPGVPKELVVDYSYDGVRQTKCVKEDETLKLP